MTTFWSTFLNNGDEVPYGALGGMHKNACEAILADRPDRGDRVDPRAAAEIDDLRADGVRKDAEIDDLRADGVRKDAEIDDLRADGVRKDAEIDDLRADGVRKDAEIDALKRANAHDGGPHAPPSHNTLSGKAEKSRKRRVARAKKPAGGAARRPG